MKNSFEVQTIIGRCLCMKNQDKNKNQQRQVNEKKPGYGDKKLDGPNRPST
jgi:hypothetical protein